MSATLARDRRESAAARGAAGVRRLGDHALVAGVAVAVFLLALAQGGYTLQGRGVAGALVWWGVVLALVLGVAEAVRLGAEALAATLALAGLAALVLASAAWSSSGERAFDEFTRAALYLGLLVLVLGVARRGTAARWCDGIAIGIVATALLALASRCFPQLIDTSSAFRFLPPGRTRLNFPVGYWNGLAVLVALGLPLLLRPALEARSRVVRALALAPFPALAVTLYLTSSRTGVIATGIAMLAFFALARRRVAAAAAIGVAGLGSAVAVVLVARRHALVDGPLGTAAARHEGWTAAVLVLVLCVLAGAAWYAAVALASGRPAPLPRTQRGLLVAVAVLLVAAIAASHPVRRFEQFKEPLPVSVLRGGPNYVQDHLFSISGNGRWAMWTQAVDQFRAHPVGGGGAGSFAEWWEQHRPAAQFVRDAHSLYLELLGELGVAGLVLVLVLFGAAAVAGARRLRAGEPAQQLTVAALLASLAAFAVGAAGDWMWELPAVGGIAIVVVALLTGRATAVGDAEERPRPALARAAVPVAVAVAAVALIAAEGLAVYGDLRLRRSQEAFARDDGASARAEALAARKVEPWAASPYLQLALVDEQFGTLSSARRWIEGATRRDPRNWSLWLVRARLETKAGAIPEARRSLARARELNPLGVPAAAG